MQAFTISSYSKTMPLTLTQLPTPTVQSNEVLIEIHATSVNPLDFKVKKGEFKAFLPKKFPLILGFDVAGVVTQIGSAVSKFKVGDEVYASGEDAFAEYVALPENDVALKPKNLTMQEAASIPLVGLTAWQVLVEKANVQKGQKVFIQAGSGGVGTIAIQLARHLGASVATTASASNIEWLKGLGASVVVDYKSQDYSTLLQNYDLVLNSQDTQTLHKSVNTLKSGGRLLSISGPPDKQFAVSQQLPWIFRIIMGLLSRSIRKKTSVKNIDYAFVFMQPNGEQLKQLTTLIEAGNIRPVLDKVFAFADTNQALALVESGRAKGKVVIAVKP